MRLRVRAARRRARVDAVATCDPATLAGYVYRDPSGFDVYVAQSDVATCEVVLRPAASARALERAAALAPARRRLSNSTSGRRCRAFTTSVGRDERGRRPAMRPSEVTYKRDGAMLRAYAAWPRRRRPPAGARPDPRRPRPLRPLPRRRAALRGRGLLHARRRPLQPRGRAGAARHAAVFALDRARCRTRACSRDLGAAVAVPRRADPRSRRERDRHHRLLHGRPVRAHGGVHGARASPPASRGTACCATRRRDAGSRRARSTWRPSSRVRTSVSSAPRTRSSQSPTSPSCARSSSARGRRSRS